MVYIYDGRTALCRGGGVWFTSMMEEQLYMGEEGEWFTSMMEEQLYVGEEGCGLHLW